MSQNETICTCNPCHADSCFCDSERESKGASDPERCCCGESCGCGPACDCPPTCGC